jgi:DNA mismatch repair protein MutS
VPRELIARAKEILVDIEKDAEDLAPRIARSMPGQKEKAKGPTQLGLFEPARSKVEQELEKVDLDRLTPIEALLLLRELRQML